MACQRCGATDVVTGQLGLAYARPDGTAATGMRVLCEACADLLWRFLHDPVRHVNISDPVTPWGNAHIVTCPSCSAKFGSWQPERQS